MWWNEHLHVLSSNEVFKMSISLYLFLLKKRVFTISGLFWLATNNYFHLGWMKEFILYFLRTSQIRTAKVSCSPATGVLRMDGPWESVVKQPLWGPTVQGWPLRRLLPIMAKPQHSSSSGPSPITIRAQDIIWWEGSILSLEVKTFRVFILNCVIAETWY